MLDDPVECGCARARARITSRFSEADGAPGRAITACSGLVFVALMGALHAGASTLAGCP
jgi:hypothetical protein